MPPERRQVASMRLPITRNRRKLPPPFETTTVVAGSSSKLISQGIVAPASRKLAHSCWLVVVSVFLMLPLMLPCGGSTPPPNNSHAATSTFNVVTRTYAADQSVTVSCATSRASIYYTSDGSTPGSSSTRPTSAIKVFSTSTPKAIAVATDNTNSAIATAAYTEYGAVNS